MDGCADLSDRSAAAAVVPPDLHDETLWEINATFPGEGFKMGFDGMFDASRLVVSETFGNARFPTSVRAFLKQRAAVKRLMVG